MRNHIVQLKAVAPTALCCLLLVGGCHKKNVRGESVQSGAGADAEPLSVRFHEEGHAFAHVLPPVKAPRGVDSARASDCGRCHTEFYREWSDSTHAQALRDIQYQAELFKPDTPRWLCLNCHIPIQNQRREIVVGLEDGSVLKPVVVENTEYDGEMRDEAITCATCHVRVDDAGESYVIGPLGDTDALHPVREDRAFLRRICLRCHDPRSEEITETFVCSFSTKRELEEGPYAEKKDCVDCHLPKTKRQLVPDLPGYPAREAHAHHWVGGGVPKTFDLYEGLIARGYQSGLDVSLDSWTLSPDNSRVEFSITLKNARAGHWITTSDPERFILAMAYLSNLRGERLAELSERVGQTWKWYPRAEKVGDNRLESGEERGINGTLELPAEEEGLKLTVLVYHVRLKSSNAEHMKLTEVKDTYVPGVSKRTKRIDEHYPMSTIIYYTEVNIATGERYLASSKKLIQLSKEERNKSLSVRDY